MIIKLTKRARIEGVLEKSGTIHEVTPRIGGKLVDRGYAKPHDVAKEVIDDGASDS